jgi:hypothetical protein
MANIDIGLIACPCCEWPDAHVRETIKKKAYIVCDECSSQTFARGPLSHDRIVNRMRPVAAPVAPETPPEQEAAPMPAKKPAAKKPAPKAAPPKAAEPKPAAPPKAGDDDFESFVGGKPAKAGDDDFGNWLTQ